MEIRHATNPMEAKNYTTEQLRNHYLAENLFEKGELKMLYSHEDRMVVGGAIPFKEPLLLEATESLKTNYFLERRELGIINVGNQGSVTVDGERYILGKKDCLYIGMGKEDVRFESEDSDNPARFYLVSTLAHREYPTKKVAIDQAEPNRLGSIAESNERTIYKYIHSEGVQSCQLMLGMTLLEPNNMWNTMPAHIHDRRSEIYFYFDMPDKGKVFHFMGQPDETRHLVVGNEQVVVSPAWSIHSGVGTSNYSFIWAMAGENYSFTDMDFIDMNELK